MSINIHFKLTEAENNLLVAYIEATGRTRTGLFKEFIQSLRPPVEVLRDNPVVYLPSKMAHPEYFLRECMKNRGLTAQDLADKMECSIDVVNGILGKRQPITPELAEKLGKALDTPAEKWEIHEFNYQYSLKDRKRGRKKKVPSSGVS